jgi:hypothetical protein
MMGAALKNRYRNASLGVKFTLILTAVFLLGIVVSGFALYQAAQARAQDEITARGDVLLNTMNAVRRYTSGHVNPLLAPQMETQDRFIPESVPAFSARTVFEEFRRNEDFDSFFYKEATLNPTNPVDKADSFERDLVNRFRDDPALEEQTGFRTASGERVFYIARPLRVSAESCLTCHSSPETAPQALLATYGDQGGFGWQLNEVVAAQIIYVPASDVLNRGRALFLIAIAMFAVVFAIAIILLNRLLKPAVIQPAQQMAALAQDIIEDKMDTERFHPEYLTAVAQRGDELGHMARVFQQMVGEIRQREKRMKTELQQLRVEIDEVRRTREVRQITESEYFRDLQTRATDLRRRFKKDRPE